MSRSLVDDRHKVVIATNRNYAQWCGIGMHNHTWSRFESRSWFHCVVETCSLNACWAATCRLSTRFIETNKCFHLPHLFNSSPVGMHNLRVPNTSHTLTGLSSFQWPFTGTPWLHRLYSVRSFINVNYILIFLHNTVIFAELDCVKIIPQTWKINKLHSTIGICRSRFSIAGLFPPLMSKTNFSLRLGFDNALASSFNYSIRCNGLSGDHWLRSNHLCSSRGVNEGLCRAMSAHSLCDVSLLAIATTASSFMPFLP